MQELGWPLSERAQSEIDDKKRKPSKEIRVDAMRDAVEFVQRTSSRGRGKAILVFPAEQMNAITANALLKTLEEPPGDVRFVLATESAHQLLPTIRSRCISHSMRWPTEAESVRWLQSRGVAPDLAAASLKNAGGRPDDALDFMQSGRDMAVWKHLRGALSRGDVGIFKDWTLAQQLDALQKLCHDLMAQHVQSAPRFIDSDYLGPRVPLRRLCAWQKELSNATKTCEHPFNAGLMTEALVSQARITLNSKQREIQ